MDKYGFVYIWYDRKRKMYYIGSHWGTEDDGYICSSNRMRNAYRRRPNDFKRRILSRVYTDRSSLLDEEQRWFDRVKRKDRYYNIQWVVRYPWWLEDSSEIKLSISEKQSIAKLGNQNRRGIPHTEETKAKISRAMNRPETKEKISTALKGRILSEEVKRKRKKKKRKTYSFISPDGETIITDNLSEFCGQHNLQRQDMSMLANGTLKRNVYKGWRASN